MKENKFYKRNFKDESKIEEATNTKDELFVSESEFGLF